MQQFALLPKIMNGGIAGIIGKYVYFNLRTYSSLLVAKIWKKYFHVFFFYQPDWFRCNLCISLGSCQDKASEPKGKNT